MVSDRSKKMYRLLFENTFLGKNLTYEEMGVEAGYGKFLLQPWLDSNSGSIENLDEKIWRLSPRGIFDLMTISGFRKYYSSDEQDMVISGIEKYKQEIKIGEVDLGGSPYYYALEEAVKLTRTKVFFTLWSFDRREHMTEKTVISKYESDFGHERVGYDYILPGQRDWRLKNQLLIELVKTNLGKRPTDVIYDLTEVEYNR
jgi:hypothetical protein